MTRKPRPRVLIAVTAMIGFWPLAYMMSRSSDPTWAILLAIYIVFAIIILNVDVGGM
jgi:hypothetical protein